MARSTNFSRRQARFRLKTLLFLRQSKARWVKQYKTPKVQIFNFYRACYLSHALRSSFAMVKPLVKGWIVLAKTLKEPDPQNKFKRYREV
jgi:hypothetical protein